jgi:muconolactone delta-isomerase
MKIKRFEKINTPTSYDDIRDIKRKYKVGTILEDKNKACLWCRDNRSVVALMISNSGLRGNSIETPAFETEICEALWRMRTRCSNFGSYGVFDAGDFRTVYSRLLDKDYLSKQNKKTWLQLRKVVSGIPVSDFKEEVQKVMEFGVELELESDESIDGDDREKLQAKYKDLIQDVGTDGSVANGVEIRFRHPTLRGWKLDQVKSILDDAKALGLKSEWGTAGMHIHISHKDIRKAIPKFIRNLYEMENILYPIGCRTKKVGRSHTSDRCYGIGSDLYRNQEDTFGTLEIRAWNATTNPDVFLARIRIAKALVEFLLTDLPVNISEFFRWMPKARKKDYKFLLETENPREYGLPNDVLLGMLK